MSSQIITAALAAAAQKRRDASRSLSGFSPFERKLRARSDKSASRPRAAADIPAASKAAFLMFLKDKRLRPAPAYKVK